MKLFLYCLSLVGLLATASAQTCTPWKEAEYETSEERYQNGEGTPRGFRQDTIPNPETAKDSEYPCITVQANSTIQYMEILIQTTSPTGASTICIEVEGIEGVTCSSGSASFCDKVPSLNSKVTFNCQSASCDQSTVDIYYRANLSRSDIDDEYWCADRIQDYPSGLITFIPPSDITPQTQFTQSALGLHSFSVTLLLTLCVLALVMVVRLY